MSTASTRPVYVRRDIGSLDPNGSAMASLRRGVQVMQTRPASEPTSWLFQANIHGTNDTSPNPAWNQCQHGSFFFLAWHRMYLYGFERILRAASGDPNFALPYWNYTTPTQRMLPLAFRQPADASNPLFVSVRNTDSGGVNNGAQLPASATSYAAAFAYTNFASPPGSATSFGGERLSQPTHVTRPHGALEQQPHDIIHGLIGGSGWMGDVNMAARDPIFWLHHANIDRLWKRWLDQGGNRQNPVTDQAWMTIPFTFFDENGQEVRMAGRDILDTETQLGYRYDDDPPPAVAARIFAVTPAMAAAAAERPPTALALSPESRVELGTAPVTVTMAVTAEAQAALALTATPEANEVLVLTIEGIDYDANPGVYYEIYLNLPPDVHDPDHQSIYYAGNLGFFALTPMGHSHEMAAGEPSTGGRLSLEITGTVREQKRRQIWNAAQVSVTFIMRGLVPPAGQQPTTKPGPKAHFTRVTMTRE